MTGITSNRQLVERTVKDNKGISFSELKDQTDLSNGVLQYHIRKSDHIEKKKGAILYEGACKNCDLKGKCKDKCLKKELRKPIIQDIKRMYVEETTQSDIARKLGKDRSTVNYHVQKLRDLELLD
ncbi:MAG: winged helix-turn-helix transcriptional regulator [Candidatus Nanohaloarchaea archaeon]